MDNLLAIDITTLNNSSIYHRIMIGATNNGLTFSIIEIT